MIPVYTPKYLLTRMENELLESLRVVLGSGRLIQDAQVAAWEKEFAAWQGLGDLVTTSNGTIALQMAFSALGLAPGDKVLLPAFGAPAVLTAILAAGLRPVFCDVSTPYPVPTAGQVEAAAVPGIRAFLWIHLFGFATDLREIRAVCQRRGWFLIEDCAQAAGSLVPGGKTPVGSQGDLSIFSFYPTKNIPGVSDGGGVGLPKTTSRKWPELRDKMLSWRDLGQAARHEINGPGQNARMSEFSAVALRRILAFLGKEAYRREWEDFCRDYRFRLDQIAKSLKTFQAVKPAISLDSPGELEGVWQHLMVLLADRDDQRDHWRHRLEEGGVATAVHYPLALPQMSVLGKMGVPVPPENFPVATAFTRRALTLPLFPGMGAARRDRVLAAVNEYCQFVE